MFTTSCVNSLMFLLVIAILDLPAKLVEAAASFITIHQFCVYGTVDPKVHACLGMNYDVSIFSTNHKYDGKFFNANLST